MPVIIVMLNTFLLCVLCLDGRGCRFGKSGDGKWEESIWKHGQVRILISGGLQLAGAAQTNEKAEEGASRTLLSVSLPQPFCLQWSQPGPWQSLDSPLGLPRCVSPSCPSIHGPRPCPGLAASEPSSLSQTASVPGLQFLSHSIQQPFNCNPNRTEAQQITGWEI